MESHPSPPPPPLATPATTTGPLPPPPQTAPQPHSNSSPPSRKPDSGEEQPNGVKAIITTATTTTTITTTTTTATSKLRLMCSFGGHIVPRPHDKSLCYAGGDTRIMSVDRHISLSELQFRLSKTLLNGNLFKLKYQLPTEDLDALITVGNDEDLENMVEEYDRLVAFGDPSSKASRLRLYLLPLNFDPENSSSVDSILGGSKYQDWFRAALNWNPPVCKKRSSVNHLLGLDDAVQFSAPKRVETLIEANGCMKSGGKAGNSTQEIHSVQDSPPLDNTTSSYGSSSSATSNTVQVEEGSVANPKEVVGWGIEEHLQQINVVKKEEELQLQQQQHQVFLGIEEHFQQMNVVKNEEEPQLQNQQVVAPPQMQQQQLVAPPLLHPEQVFMGIDEHFQQMNVVKKEDEPQVQKQQVMAPPQLQQQQLAAPPQMQQEQVVSLGLEEHSQTMNVVKKEEEPQLQLPQVVGQPQLQQQQQQVVAPPQLQHVKPSGGSDLPSPDSVSSDISVQIPVSRQNPVVYQGQSGTGAHIQSGNERNLVDTTTTRMQVQQVHNSGYVYPNPSHFDHHQYQQLRHPSQQFVPASSQAQIQSQAQYVQQHHQPGTMPQAQYVQQHHQSGTMPVYYGLYTPPQQQLNRPSGMNEQRPYPVYIMPTPPQMAPPPGNTSEMVAGSGVYRMPAGPPALQEVVQSAAPSENGGIPQVYHHRHHHQPSQAVNPDYAGYRYLDLSNGHIFYTQQPLAPTQYQTIAPPAPRATLSEVPPSLLSTEKH